MSTKTGLYREFAKAFTRKTAYVLFWMTLALVVAIVFVGAIFVVTEIASFILSVTPLEDNFSGHMLMSILVMVVFAGLFRIAYSAWVEAKTVTGDN